MTARLSPVRDEAERQIEEAYRALLAAEEVFCDLTYQAAREGLISVRAIAAATGISKSQVDRIVNDQMGPAAMRWRS